ncbi:MAG: tetratricopeptide repeat-containing protein, partial [Betaproteobacteria bacterium]
LRAPGDVVPFDLLTDRYLQYDPANPKATVPALTATIRASLASEGDDSPVFRLLPAMSPQDPNIFLTIPCDFGEACARAVANNCTGDLALLGQEAHGCEWEMAGLRLVGNAQIDARDYEGARVTWEAVRASDVDDIEANLRLGTVYQRLADLPRSDAAVTRALKAAVGRGNRSRFQRGGGGYICETETSEISDQRAEAFALRGRNAKMRWLESWRTAAPDAWAAKALESPLLREAYRGYKCAFLEDLNAFYPGLNALALLTITVALAQQQPEIWATVCDDGDEPATQLEQCQRRLRSLTGSLEFALKAAKGRQDRDQLEDRWLRIGLADLGLYGPPRPARVAADYRAALINASDFSKRSVRDQLQILIDLGVCKENATAALAQCSQSTADATPGRILVFTGHRIDEDGRAVPRFPKAAESAARDAIRAAIQNELAANGGVALGLAGGANGGDILFHEVCFELGVPTRLYLALPPEQFIPVSVAPAGPDWIDRFNRLLDREPPRVLQDSETMPSWLSHKSKYNVWQRNNLWVLFNALTCGARRCTAIALWDGASADSAGGTEDLVCQARSRGAKTVTLDTRSLFASRTV